MRKGGGGRAEAVASAGCLAAAMWVVCSRRRCDVFELGLLQKRYGRSWMRHTRQRGQKTYTSAHGRAAPLPSNRCYVHNRAAPQALTVWSRCALRSMSLNAVAGAARAGAANARAWPTARAAPIRSWRAASIFDGDLQRSPNLK